MVLFIFLSVLLFSVHSRVFDNNNVTTDSKSKSKKHGSRSFERLVVGGERAGLGTLSFMASLSLPPAKDKRYHFCGGSLISPTHVLTAAHCLDGSLFEVRFGSTDLSMAEPNSEVIGVKKTYIHPEFDLYTMANDIAIIELSSPSRKPPIYLSGWIVLDSSSPGSDDGRGGESDRGIIAGWGALNADATRYPDQMYDASVPIVSLDQCFRLYGHTLVDMTKLCISVNEGKDTCSGDSGGPLFTPHPSLPDRYVQLGIVSWGSEPCGNSPAVYIRVAYYSSWISSIIPSLGRPLTWFDATNPATFDLLGSPPTPVPQSAAPSPPRLTPFPTKREIGLNIPTSSRTPTTPTQAPSLSLPASSFASSSPAITSSFSSPLTTAANTATTSSATSAQDCSCTQEKNRFGSTCDIHDNDPLGAWCWVGDSCSTAVLTWWGAKYVYCVLPYDDDDDNGGSDSSGSTLSASSTTLATPAVTEILLAQNWSAGIPSTWKIVDRGDYMSPSVWTVDTDSKQPLLRQSSNIMVLEPRIDLAKQGTYLVYTPSIQSWMDYEFSVNIASTDNDILGVMFRYVDDKNYYRFSIDKQSVVGSRRLVSCVNGVFSLLASDDVTYTVGVFYLLTVIVQQAHLQVMMNGQKVFDVSDSYLPAGSVALYSWANQDSIFDSVLVSRPGSIAIRRLVQPIYGRALSSQQLLHDSLDRPETTTEEGDYDFNQTNSSSSALTIGLVISLVVVLVISGIGFYYWKKRRNSPSFTKTATSHTTKDIELEGEGQVTRIKVVAIRSPLRNYPCTTNSAAIVDLDAQDTCDSPSSETTLRSEQSSPPPLPSWPHERHALPRTPERTKQLGTPERRLKGRSPASRSSPVKNGPRGTYQHPTSYSLKEHQTSPHKTPATMSRDFTRRQNPILEKPYNQSEQAAAQRFLETPSSTVTRFTELRQRVPRSPETTPTPPLPPHTSPDILMPSPISLTPELPAFPFYVSPPSEPSEASQQCWQDPKGKQRPDPNTNERFMDDSPSHIPMNHSLELSPLEEPVVRAQAKPVRYQQHQQEVWEEIRFGDDSDASDEGLMEYFDER